MTDWHPDVLKFGGGFAVGYFAPVLRVRSDSAAPPPTRDDARCPDVGVEKANP